MRFSDKTTRRVERYVVTLVKKQPLWLRKLFESEQVCFSWEDDGTLELSVDQSLPYETKEKARVLIAAYLEKTPCRVLKEHVIQ